MPINPTFNAAANAYSATAGLKGGLGAPEMPDGGSDILKPSFMDVLTDALDAARDTGYLGEAKSAEAVAGKAELHELVTAVANAELTLQTIVALRDRAISAYNDIIKMPI